MKKPFKLEFDDTGGYDAMSSAYIIYDADDKNVCKVDVEDYVDTSDWQVRHSENDEAKKVANIILEALNEKF